MAGLTVADNQMLVWDQSKASLQTKLGELVQYFQVGITTNADGIPMSYIDPTQILPHLMEVDVPDDLDDEIVESAKTPIDFSDGFPTVEGIPFWERLEGEPVPYYNLFKEYREMKYVGMKTENGTLTRSIAKLSESSNMAGKHLNALARVYHWQVRVKAYDLYKSLERGLARQRDIELMENKHAKVSNQLLDQAVDYLLEHPEQMSPKVAIDLYKIAMSAGRLALGLNPDKPGSSSGSGGGGTHISITNQNANSEGNVSQTNMDLSAVEKKTLENSQNMDNVQSILHILNASGAFKTAAGQEAPEKQLDEDGNVIDADYETEE